MEIFVISLKRSQDRRDAFDKNNSAYIPKYTYFDAIDGSTLSDSFDPAIFTRGSANYTKGAIGCALSHLKLWEKCIELDKPIIIMEDDAIVSRNFNKHVNNIVNNTLPKDWEIVQLSYNFDSVLSYYNTVYEQCNCTFGQRKMTQEDITNFVNSKINTTVAKLVHCFGTSAYMIHPKGAKILKDKCFPLSNRIVSIPYLNQLSCFTIDGMMNSVYKDMNAYVCIIPFVITPHISDDYQTTIR